MDTITASTSKVAKLRAELEAIQAENRKREAQKKALLQQAEALDNERLRKKIAHAKYCLGGAIMKYKPEYADEMLAALTTDPKAPKGHADAIGKLFIDRATE